MPGSAYSPLPGRHSIRLLRLFPAIEASEPLQGGLTVTHLGDHPSPALDATQNTSEVSFEALSYTWGEAYLYQDPEPDNILLDGSTLDIGGNLASALRRLRLRDVERSLWIDAICIDQSNVEERTQQVGIMHLIYSTADVVIVWVGEDSEDMDGAVALTVFEYLDSQVTSLNRYSSLLSQDEKTAHLRSLIAAIHDRHPEFTITAQQWVDMVPDAWKDVKGFDFYRRKFHQDRATRIDQIRDGATNIGPEPMAETYYMKSLIKAFTDRRYFKRQWIIQEIYFARHAVLVCGAHKITLAALTKNTDSSFHSNLLGVRFPTDELNSLMLAETFHHNHLTRDLLDLLREFCDSQCADPRDKIFSLLHIDPKEWIQPDYTSCTRDVYCAFAREAVERGRGGEVLDIAARQWNADSMSREEAWEREQLPSWVPDWRLAVRASDSPPPFEAAVGSNGSLEVVVQCLGRLERNSTHGPPLVLRTSVCSASLVGNGGNIQQWRPEQVRVAFTNDAFQEGDIVVEFTMADDPKTVRVLIMRPAQSGWEPNGDEREVMDAKLIGSGDLWIHDTMEKTLKRQPCKLRLV